jgi:hypothetical protein
MKFSTKILIITTALLLGACDSNSPTGIAPVEEAPTEFAMLQALNASPDGPNVNIIVGATAIVSDLDFMGGTAEGSGPPSSQPIIVEAVIPGVDDDGDPLTEEIIAEPPIALFVDTVTTVVVTGLDGAQVLSVFVQDKTDDDGEFVAVSAGAARVFVVHADAGVGPVDVYIVAPNAVLDAPLALDIDIGESGAPTEFAAGAWELVITAAGVPDALLYNQFISLLDGDDLTFAIVPDASGFGEIQVVSMDGTGATTIYDIITPALLTIDHLSPNAGTVDADSDVFGTLVAGMVYLDSAGDLIEPGAHELSFNSVALGTLASADVAGAAGSYDAVIFDGTQVSVGGLFELEANVFTDSPRSVSSYAKARLYFASYSIGDVDVYAVALPVTEITGLDADIEAGAFRDMTGYTPLDAGDYTIFVTEANDGESPIIPIFSQAVTLANGGVYTLILSDVDDLGLDFQLTVREDNESFF